MEKLDLNSSCCCPPLGNIPTECADLEGFSEICILEKGGILELYLDRKLAGEVTEIKEVDDIVFVKYDAISHNRFIDGQEKIIQYAKNNKDIL